MVKNKVLTPVLAGVLGLSIVGSGLGYYFVNKDSNDGKTATNAPKITKREAQGLSSSYSLISQIQIRQPSLCR